MRLLIATSNRGKLRDFAAAALSHGIAVEGFPGFDALPTVREDGATFEANARKKAEHYSRYAPGELVLADDSGLEVDVLRGAPGVHSARYAALAAGLPAENSSDADNNARLLQELAATPQERHTARFICVIAVARDGRTVTTVRGEASGIILPAPRGDRGFGYDPLFLVPALGKTFAELSGEEKTAVSHRGQAFRRFLEWVEADPSHSPRSGPG